ncbi:hypothetical protein BJ912DRAFT_966280 [Pholiota molesta]|nr:hypothetical protein BJ912DRAFT_966280 [Pholiota molesta]
MSITFGNVSATSRGVHDIASTCVSRAFLDSSGLPDHRSSGKDHRESDLVPFVVMDDIPAGVSFDAERIQERGTSSELTEYVRHSATKINHDIKDKNDINLDILFAMHICPNLPIQFPPILSRGADYLRAILLGHDTTGICMSVFCNKDFDIFQLLEMHGLQFESSLNVLDEHRSRLKLLKHIVTGECYSRCPHAIGCRILSNGFASSHDISACIEKFISQSNTVDLDTRKLISFVQCLGVYGVALQKRSELMNLAKSHNISLPNDIQRKDIIRAILEHVSLAECIKSDDTPACREIIDSVATDEQFSTYQVLWVLRELRDVLNSRKMLMMLLDMYGVDYDERSTLRCLRSSLTKFINCECRKTGLPAPIPDTY